MGLGLILAGGQSKRLFPANIPKPLLKINNNCLLDEALGRLHGLETFVVTNASIAKQIRASFLKDKKKAPLFILESEGRDTAAAVGWGLREGARIFRSEPDFVAVLSADTWMPETRHFRKFLNRVKAEIKKFPDSLFVVGSPQSTKPQNTHGQFGWILPHADSSSFSMPVRRFVEKPQESVLTTLRSSGALINAGMFFGKWETFMKAYAAYYPDVLKKNVVYKKLERQPVDRAIFEKFESVRVCPLELRWEDLGTWEDWFTHVSEGEAVRHCTDRVFVRTSRFQKVYCLGVKDLAVIEEGGKLLIMPLSKTRDLKNYLAEIGE